jgi:hypothetical protein
MTLKINQKDVLSSISWTHAKLRKPEREILLLLAVRHWTRIPRRGLAGIQGVYTIKPSTSSNLTPIQINWPQKQKCEQNLKTDQKQTQS